MFRDVLVVVDATSDAREALSQAIDLAQRERSRLTLITVERRLPRVRLPRGGRGAAPRHPRGRGGGAPAHVRGGRRRTGRRAGDHGARRPPGPAGARGPDRAGPATTWWSMGAPPQGRVRSAFGSLSHYLVRHSPAPVLVVHAGPPRGRVITRTEAPATRARRWATRSRVA